MWNSFHLSVLATMLSRVVCTNETHLSLVALRKRIAALFTHSLYLSDFTNCFLKLFHSATLAGFGGEGKPWSIICDVEFLDFLDVMVFFRKIHSSGTIVRGVLWKGRMGTISMQSLGLDTL